MTTPRAGHAAALDFVPTAGVASSSGCAGSQSEQKPADQSTGTITRQKAGTYAESDLRTVTLTVKEAVPGAVGVPLSSPSLDRVRPAGSEPPVTLKVRMPVPPFAGMAWL